MGTEPTDVREVHEKAMLRPLRGLIVVIVALAIVAAVIGSKQMRLFMPLCYLPAAIAFKRPRWSQILIWIMWSSSWGMLAAIIAIEGRPGLFTVPSHGLVASSMVLLCIALPLLRWVLASRSAPSSLPQARVHRRE